MSDFKRQLHTLPLILALAGPTMLEHVLATAVQYIDTAMVGALGTSATATVGATTTLGWLVNGTVSALSIGFLSMIAQAYGAGDTAKVKRICAQSVLITLLSGIFFTLLCLGLAPKIPIWMRVDPALQKTTAAYFSILYAPMLFRAATLIFGTVLRAAGDTRTPMLVGVFVNALNVILNFFLIYPTREITLFGETIICYGAGKGVIGAGLASAIAFTAGGILITAAIFRHKDLSPRGVSIAPDLSILRPCMRISLPNALQRFGTSLGYVVFAAMINSLGEAATAAHTIANTVESAFYIPGYGMQTAAATLAGNARGARDHEKMRDYSGMLLWLEVLLMLLSGGLLFAFAPAMVRLFNKDAAVILLGVTVLRMVAVTEPIYGVSLILEGMLQGVGKTRLPFVFNILGMWGIRILGTFLCITFFAGGLVAAWACMIAHNLLLFLLFVLYCARRKNNPLLAME